MKLASNPVCFSSPRTEKLHSGMAPFEGTPSAFQSVRIMNYTNKPLYVYNHRGVSTALAPIPSSDTKFYNKIVWQYVDRAEKDIAGSDTQQGHIRRPYTYTMDAAELDEQHTIFVPSLGCTLSRSETKFHPWRTDPNELDSKLPSGTPNVPFLVRILINDPNKLLESAYVGIYNIISKITITHDVARPAFVKAQFFNKPNCIDVTSEHTLSYTWPRAKSDELNIEAATQEAMNDLYEELIDTNGCIIHTQFMDIFIATDKIALEDVMYNYSGYDKKKMDRSAFAKTLEEKYSKSLEATKEGYKREIEEFKYEQQVERQSKDREINNLKNKVSELETKTHSQEMQLARYKGIQEYELGVLKYDTVKQTANQKKWSSTIDFVIKNKEFVAVVVGIVGTVVGVLYTKQKTA